MSLDVQTAHRADCVFGTGFYRIRLKDGGVRYCQTEPEVRRVFALLAHDQTLRVERDGHCLDSPYQGDAHTPDVVDGEAWLALPRAGAMAELGITDEVDYRRAYTAIEAAVVRRDNRQSQGGVRASIVVKRKGARVIDASRCSTRGRT